jgi:Fe-S oxidoreductase
MKYLFAPGCALLLYKPHLAEKIHQGLNAHFGNMGMLLTCCRHTPAIPAGTRVINTCPGCDRRYRENCANPSTVSLWEVLLEMDAFAFPDYAAQPMTILDACPTRDQDRVHDAVRAVAGRMNISVVEPARTRKKSTCCGDTFFGNVPAEQVVSRMKAKAGEMPLEDIIVYCVSCCESMGLGGKRPRYLVDLLFSEETTPRVLDPDRWHGMLDNFIAQHQELEVRCG